MLESPCGLLGQRAIGAIAAVLAVVVRLRRIAKVLAAPAAIVLLGARVAGPVVLRRRRVRAPARTCTAAVRNEVRRVVVPNEDALRASLLDNLGEVVVEHVDRDDHRVGRERGATIVLLGVDDPLDAVTAQVLVEFWGPIAFVA